MSKGNAIIYVHVHAMFNYYLIPLSRVQNNNACKISKTGETGYVFCSQTLYPRTTQNTVKSLDFGKEKRWIINLLVSLYIFRSLAVF